MTCTTDGRDLALDVPASASRSRGQDPGARAGCVQDGGHHDERIGYSGCSGLTLGEG